MGPLVVATAAVTTEAVIETKIMTWRNVLKNAVIRGPVKGESGRVHVGVCWGIAIRLPPSNILFTYMYGTNEH